jgi:thiamine-phosphate pyrophosphorylase
MLSPLCAIVDADAAACAGWTALDLARAYLDGGARFLQLRAKRLPGGALLELASALVASARPAGAVVIVNDRADIARLSDADGVHVGQDDLRPAAARALVGAAAVVGVSTHTAAQLDAAMNEPISYLAIGPVFVTTTKETGYRAVGIEMVRAAADRARPRALPVVAIGGITIDTAPATIEAGAAAVAVIGDLLSSGNPGRRVREYLDRLEAVGAKPTR